MRMRHPILILGLMSVGLTACHKDRVTNKVIDGLPVHTETSIVPAQATQHIMILKALSMPIITAVINRTILTNQTYPELTPGPNDTYSLVIHDERAGSVTFTLQFFSDIGTGVIDPIEIQTSTSSLKSVGVNGAGGSALFPSYTEATLLIFDTAGDLNSNLRSTGTIQMSGSGYALLFDIPSPGAQATSRGLRNGAVTATGTGPSAPVTMDLRLNNQHELDGTLSWENQSGQIHMDSDDGFVILNNSRIPIN